MQIIKAVVFQKIKSEMIGRLRIKKIYIEGNQATLKDGRPVKYDKNLKKWVYEAK